MRSKAIISVLLATCAAFVHFAQGQTFTEVNNSFAGLMSGSASWGDYDNDGDLDLLTTGLNGALVSVTKLYRNDGSNTFTEVYSALPTLGNSPLVWGDYDRDNYIDLVVFEASGFFVYRNKGNGTFIRIGPLPMDFQDGESLSWGDFDNDGDLDILRTGDFSARIYRYDGGTNFTPLATPFPNVSSSVSVWIDYNTDGRLDVLVTGSTTGQPGGAVTSLFKNMGNGQFVPVAAGFPGVQQGAVAWGDYDNDGDPDLLLAGLTLNGDITRIYRNDGNDTFVDIGAGLPGTHDGSAVWGDLDNDGKLDIVLTGEFLTRVFRNDNLVFVDLGLPLPNVAMGRGMLADFDNDGSLDLYLQGQTNIFGTMIGRLFKNNSFTPNSRPSAPIITNTVVLGGSVTVAWAPAVDANQPAGLTYNLSLGTAPGLANIVNPMANLTNGYRRLPADGNMGSRCAWFITNLPVGTYFCSVQAVDHSFAGSDFSPIASFDVTQPSISDISNQVMTTGVPIEIEFAVSAPGTSLDTLILTAKSSDTNVIPPQNIIFGGSGSNRNVQLTAPLRTSGNSTITISVTDTNGGTASDDFAVTVREFSQSILNLDGLTNDFALPGDFDNDGKMDLFVTSVSNTTHSSRIYRNVGNNTFTNTFLALPPGERGEAAWGDFNKDGFLDLAIGGAIGSSNVVRIFRNNSGSSFSDIGALITGTIAQSRMAWGDYDNDGDLDLVVTRPGGTQIFRQIANETFEDSGVGFLGVTTGSVSWGDYDNDGDLDLLLSGGTTNSTRLCWVYENKGAGVFSLAVSNLTDVAHGSAVWGDFDSDGLLDIAATGEAVFGISVPSCTVYRNLGGGQFSAISNDFSGLNYGMAAWGDFDNDGRADLATGAPYSSTPTPLYRNRGNNLFEDTDGGLSGVSDAFVYWSDFDNDGDLDLLASGYTNSSPSGFAVVLFKNLTPITNTVPTPPTLLTATLLPENEVVLSWNNGADIETTNAAGLSYNVRVGSSPGGIDRVPPQAHPITGVRRIFEIGNAGSSHVLRLLDVPRGTNYWSVQAIDPALAGSAFAVEATFVITNGRPVLSQIANQTNFPNAPISIPFLVDDVETSASNLVIDVTSSNTVFVPNANLILGGSGTNRSLNITAAITADATSLITIRVTDSGGLSVTNSFLLRQEQFSTTGVNLTNVTRAAIAWGDSDGDGDLDLLIAGIPSSNPNVTRLYRNDGAGVFTELNPGIPGVGFGSVSWGDYDRDGDIDLLLSGGSTTRIYRNNGGNSFSDIGASLVGVASGTVAWGDYDGDGDLDAAVTGISNSVNVTRLYRNIGSDTFEDANANLPTTANSTLAWGDFDGDGDNDLLVSGDFGVRICRNDGNGLFTPLLISASANRRVAVGDFDNDGDLDVLRGGLSETRILRNDGNYVFTQLAVAFPGVGDGSVSWGDFDNDGDLDMLLTGNNSVLVYRNDGNGTFTDAGVVLPGVSSSMAAWGDYDSDGDLDFIYAGSPTIFSMSTRLVRNNYNVPNSPPLPPTGLTTAFAGTSNSIALSWDLATDAQTTNANGLGYNVRVGTTPGSANVMSPESNLVTGQRSVARLGNAGPTNRWVLSNLAPGNYYWSVQAIDTAFAGSAFANEASFAITNSRPTITSISNRITSPIGQTIIPFTIGDAETPATNLVLSGRSSVTNVIANQSISFSGSGSNRTVILQPNITNGTTAITVTVTDADGAYASTTFLVTLQQFTVFTNALPPVQLGSMAWADYDNDGDLDVLLIGTNFTLGSISRIYRNEGDGVFTNINAGLPGITYGAVAWADYDNDGDLDFILTGLTNSADFQAIARLYRNNGNGTFTLAASLGGISHNAVAWGDLDNDGDLDLIMTGRSTSGAFATTFYRNNGGVFAIANSFSVSGLESGGFTCADYDNDGDLDCLLTGGNASLIFRNNGSFSFTTVSVAIPVLATGMHVPGDYDNDGDMDVLLTGNASSVNYARVYRNDGNLIFTNVTPNPPGMRFSSAAWGDYDNDGWLDILIAGQTNLTLTINPVTRVYRNLTGTNFIDLQLDLLGVYSSSVAWVDYDNDGDLDAYVTGIYTNSFGIPPEASRLYRNNSSRSNSPPGIPANLVSVVSNRNVTLTWTRPADLETTNSKGLSYSVRVGTNSGGSQIVSPPADLATGFRRVLDPGAATTNAWRLTFLPPGTYYWSVQAVDTAFAGSPFATESVFVITNNPPIATSRVFVLGEDTPRNISIAGSDPDSQTLTYSILSGPTNGTLSGTAPSLSYLPRTNYFGADGFTFQISDGITNASASALLVITQVLDVAYATLLLQALPGGQMQGWLSGEPFERYRIEASQDFVAWTPVTNFVLTNYPMGFFDPYASNFSYRFYRSAWELPQADFGPATYSTSGQFRLTIGGELGRRYRVEASTNLTDWIVLTNVILTNGSTPVVDSEASKFSRRFYRFSLLQ